MFLRKGFQASDTFVKQFRLTRKFKKMFMVLITQLKCCTIIKVVDLTRYCIVSLVTKISDVDITLLATSWFMFINIGVSDLFV